MKKFSLTLCLVLVGLMASAQTNFRDISFNEGLKAAKAENKLLFVDCYTAWCGPCKMMANKVFPDSTLGAWMNNKFVCIKIDMEKGEGPELGKRYDVNAFPTFLVLNHEGKLQGRTVGGMSAEKFSHVIDSVISNNKVAAMTAEYDGGRRDADFLKEYMDELKSQYMMGAYGKVVKVALAGKTAEEIVADKFYMEAFFDAHPQSDDKIFRDIYSLSLSQPDKFTKDLNAKINGVWSGGGFHYMEFDGHDVKGFDEAGFDRYVDTLRQLKVSCADNVAYSVKAYAYSSFKQYDKLFPLVVDALGNTAIEDYIIGGFVDTLEKNITDKKQRKTLLKAAEKRVAALKADFAANTDEKSRKKTQQEWMLKEYEKIIASLQK